MAESRITTWPEKTVLDGTEVMDLDDGEHKRATVATLLNPIRGRTQSLIPFGDSLTATMWRPSQLTGTITVSGSVATFTTSDAVKAHPGTKFRLALCDFADYNDVHTITAVPTSTQISFTAPSGAPASESVVSQIAYFENDQDFLLNWVHALGAYSKQRFNINWNGGVGGDKISDGLARVADVVAQSPDRSIVMFGTNDATSATSQDVTSDIADLKSICTALLGAGIAVDLCTIPPFGSGYADVSSTTKVGWMMEYNRQIRDYANSTAGIMLHDVYAWVTDPAEANGQAQSGTMESAGIHFDATAGTSGANIVGKNMAANYDTWLGSHTPDLPVSQADGATFNSSSKNKFLNHFFQGTTLASSWSSVYTGTSNTQVQTCPARTVVDDGDTLGNNQKSALTAVSNGTHLVYQNPTARLTVGKTYKAVAAVTLDPDTLTALLCEVICAFEVDGFQRHFRAGLNKVAEAGNYVFETPPFTWPSGASSPIFYLQAKTTGTGSPVVEWGRVALLEVD